MVYCLILSFLLLSTACSKKDVSSQNDDEEQSELNVAKGPWTWVGLLIGAVTVIIKVTEGQYKETTITYPDGTTITTKECSGMGHCHMAAYLNGPNNTYGSAISSSQEDDGYDFMCEAQLVKTSNGHVLLKMENTYANADACQRFLYDSILSFSQSFVIDNGLVLSQLGKTSNNSIVIAGEYDVYDSQDGKFIILE